MVPLVLTPVRCKVERGQEQANGEWWRPSHYTTTLFSTLFRHLEVVKVSLNRDSLKFLPERLD